MLSQIIPLDSTKNTRDLGGYVTKDGRTVKPGRLLRSDQLNALTENDIRILKTDYDLKWIVDLRGIHEATGQPDIVPDGVNYIRLPILRDHENAYGKQSGNITSKLAAYQQLIDTLGGDCRGDFLNMYNKMAYDPFCITQYRKFFELLLNQNEGAVLWHCAAGKDRTGILAIQILLALDVDLETIRTDYLESTPNLMPKCEPLFDSLRAEGADEAMIQQLSYIFVVYPEYFDTALAAINRTWGDTDAYVRKALGLTSLKLKRFREMYLD